MDTTRPGSTHKDSQALQDRTNATHIYRAIAGVVPDLIHQIGQVGPGLHSVLWQGLDGHGLGPSIDVGHNHPQPRFYSIPDKFPSLRFPATVKEQMNTRNSTQTLLQFTSCRGAKGTCAQKHQQQSAEGWQGCKSSSTQQNRLQCFQPWNWSRWTPGNIFSKVYWLNVDISLPSYFWKIA